MRLVTGVCEWYQEKKFFKEISFSKFDAIFLRVCVVLFICQIYFLVQTQEDKQTKKMKVTRVWPQTKDMYFTVFSLGF